MGSLPRVLAVLLFAAVMSPAVAQRIVDRAFVTEAIQRGVVLWDVRAARDYAERHLPGAVGLGDAGEVLRDPNTEDYLPLDRLEKLLGDAGIDPAQEVIVYGSRGSAVAYFAFQTLGHFGAERHHVYHGGIEDWIEGGGAVTTEPGRRAPVALRLTPRADTMLTTPQMVSAARRGDAQIIDARTPGEFRGQDIRALRGGHIPGAVNIPYEQNWVDPLAAIKLARRQVDGNAGMSLKPTDSLRSLYANLDPSKETIVYCQSGVRASQTAAVLAELGFRNVRIYDSSWLGYGNTLDAPAENETFLNVGALMSRINRMQSRIDELEKRLGETGARR